MPIRPKVEAILGWRTSLDGKLRPYERCVSRWRTFLQVKWYRPYSVSLINDSSSLHSYIVNKEDRNRMIISLCLNLFLNILHSAGPVRSAFRG